MMSDSNKKTLLIVDDVELFIQLQISHLGRKRYDIHTAGSGSDGLELALRSAQAWVCYLYPSLAQVRIPDRRVYRAAT